MPCGCARLGLRRLGSATGWAAGRVDTRDCTRDAWELGAEREGNSAEVDDDSARKLSVQSSRNRRRSGWGRCNWEGDHVGMRCLRRGFVMADVFGTCYCRPSETLHRCELATNQRCAFYFCLRIAMATVRAGRLGRVGGHWRPAGQSAHSTGVLGPWSRNLPPRLILSSQTAPPSASSAAALSECESRHLSPP